MRKDKILLLEYIEYTYFLDEILIVSTGLRADYYNITEKLYGILRINVKYNPNESTAIRLTGGEH